MKLDLGFQRQKTDFTTSMTDISFLLIVFFMIAAVFVADQGILIELPKANAPVEPFRKADMTLIRITAGNAFQVDGQEVDREELASATERAIRAKNQAIVVIVSQTGVTYQETLSALETAKSAGGRRFSLVSEEAAPVPVQLTDGGLE